LRRTKETWDDNFNELRASQGQTLLKMETRQRAQRQGTLGSQRIKEEMRPMKFHSFTLQLQVQEKYSAKNKLYDSAAIFSRELKSQLRSDRENHNFKRAKSVELKDRRLQEAHALETKNKLKQFDLQVQECTKQRNENYNSLIKRCNNAAAMGYDNV
jgi:hypothetical protein